MPKFDIEVKLTGQDSNVFMIIGLVAKALRKAGATPEEVKEFQGQAMSGDYDNVIATATEWVDVY